MRPISVEAMPISDMVNTIIGLRPMRSPKCANTSPPTGRPMKPTPNTLITRMVPTSGPNSLGKNSLSKKIDGANRP